jgi:hypothetical protein
MGSDADDDFEDEIRVRNWLEASRMFTLLDRRIRAAEAVTKPIGKIWQSVKWGGLIGGAGIILGASPNSPLGKFFIWLTTAVPS